MDQGTLESAQWIDLPYGGVQGAADPSEPATGYFQGVQEIPSADYLKCAEVNVVDSGATLVMTHSKPIEDSKRTVEFA